MQRRNQRATVALLCLSGVSSLSACGQVEGAAPEARAVSNLTSSSAMHGLPIRGVRGATDVNQRQDTGEAADVEGKREAVDAGPPFVTIPITGCPLQGFFAPITIGDQSFTVFLDSGSSTLAVAGSDCTNCTGVTPLYAPDGTAKDLMKTTRDVYGDGTGWKGDAYSDLVEVGSVPPAVRLKFADVTSTIHKFFAVGSCTGGADKLAYQGILGLGPSDLDRPNTGDFFDQLTGTGHVTDTFAVQLCDTGGNLWLGGYDPGFTTEAPQYTPMVSNGYYSVAVNNIDVGATSFSDGSTNISGVIIDTGTTYFLLPTAAYNDIVTMLDNNSEMETLFGDSYLTGGQCKQSTESRASIDSLLPPLVFAFDDSAGGTFALSFLPTESYLLPRFIGSTTYYCPSIQDGDSEAILGAAALTGFVTIIDVGNQKIGFAPQTGCAGPTP